MEPILKFEQVSKDYPNGVHALKNVSFQVKEGEFISIIVPSGSGKSTLLRAINRLIPISGGSLWLDGQEVSRQRGQNLRKLRRKVGMIFQNYNLVYSLSVLQNVLHGRLGYMKGLKGVFGLYSEEDKKEALELLNELGLEAFSYNRASDLSGGQKQRVGIARAIMQKPKLLLCDEPIASLDPSSAKTIMDLLRDMTGRRGIACIVNLHQLDVALTYSTRIIGLRKGQIVFDGAPKDLTDADIERIYGTSKENLMLGGKSHDPHCQRGRLLGIYYPGLPASRSSQGQPHTRDFLQHPGYPGSCHVLHHRGRGPGIFRLPLWKRKGLSLPQGSQSRPWFCHLPAQHSGPGMGLHPLLLSGHRHRRRICGPVHHQLFLYGAGLRGDHGRRIPGLRGEPSGRRRHLSPESQPGHPALLSERIPLLVPLLRGGQYPRLHHRRHGRRRRGTHPLLLYQKLPL